MNADIEKELDESLNEYLKTATISELQEEKERTRTLIREETEWFEKVDEEIKKRLKEC